MWPILKIAMWVHKQRRGMLNPRHWRDGAAMHAALDRRSSQLAPATCDVWWARPADAHCLLVDDWVAVAFTAAMPVGIDVERVNPEMSLSELTPLVLTSGERTAFERLGPKRQCEGFSLYWVRKEAVLKATGFGLTLQLASFEVTGPGRPPRLVSWPPAPELVGQLSMHDLAPGPGHVGSVAVIGPCSRVRT
jgi:hypothetical protein